MIDIKSLFTKLERGTHKGRVKVTREGKTFTQIRALGKKASGRAGTGKMDKFPESIKKEILEQRSLSTSGAKIKTIVEDMISSMRPGDRDKLVNLGLINKDYYSGVKLTVTPQALTEWAKKQGVESSKTRVSGVSREKEAHADTKKELDRSNQKIGELKVAASHNLEEIKLIQRSKQESDVIRSQLGKDNRSLKEKLTACLKGKK